MLRGPHVEEREQFAGDARNLLVAGQLDAGKHLARSGEKPRERAIVPARSPLQRGSENEEDDEAERQDEDERCDPACDGSPGEGPDQGAGETGRDEAGENERRRPQDGEEPCPPSAPRKQRGNLAQSVEPALGEVCAPRGQTAKLGDFRGRLG